jgi:hypothetical protein
VHERVHAHGAGGGAVAAQTRGERVVVAPAQVAPLDHQAHVVAVGASRVLF